VALIDRIEREIAPIEVAVFNVGGNVRFGILETTSRVYRKVWEMACFAGFLTGAGSGSVMVPRGRGSIFFTGATASVRGRDGFAAFAGAKHALRALAQSMARELGPQGIHVAHLVIDGAIDTEWIRTQFPERWATRDQGRDRRPATHRRRVLDAAPAAEGCVDTRTGSAPLARKLVTGDHGAEPTAAASPACCRTATDDGRRRFRDTTLTRTPMPGSVEFLFDVGSPYSYLAARELPVIAARTGAAIAWTPILLGGVFKATGNHSPAEIPAKGRWTRIDLARSARRIGVPFQSNPHFPINTLVLMRAAAGMQMRQPQDFDRYLDAVFSAMWIEPRNLNEPAELGAMLVQAGFDPQAMLALANDPEVKDRLRVNTERAVERGVFGAPSFLIGDDLYWGTTACSRSNRRSRRPETAADDPARNDEAFPAISRTRPTEQHHGQETHADRHTDR
jgi:2-hydroxychromene-2-carboxylate isomerase